MEPAFVLLVVDRQTVDKGLEKVTFKLKKTTRETKIKSVDSEKW